MARTKRIILHVGAPKCGSSALQTAMSLQPRLKTATRETLSYHALRPQGDSWKPVSGRMVKLGRTMTSAGYVSCPDFPDTADHHAIAAGLDQIYRSARPKFTPVMSQEGWYNRAGLFQKLLPHWFEPSNDAPQIEVIAYVRPPIDWLNAAYWQWGAWGGQDVETWMARTNLNFRMGAALGKWAALPNVNLSVQFGGDVLTHFEKAFDVRIKHPQQVNSAQSPAMIGFMQRNPEFRSSGHDVEAEFIVQRWCPAVDARRLWALSPRHFAQLDRILGDDTDALFALSPDNARKALGDPRWTSQFSYLDVLALGPSDLANRTELAALFTSVCAGLKAVSSHKGRHTVDLPPAPEADAAIDVWDAAIAHVLRQIIQMDRDLRRVGLLNRIEVIAARLPFKR
ncbi:hypothetical protein [Pseudooctadecabacter sp.]|uniref:hypothetical protein n=1 Tax=Pseudooctadecabacter sp. TaxID=1966338 RepID=UPI003F6D276A